MQPLDSQVFESFLPTYDVAPQTYEEGRAFMVEQLKKTADAVNIREIGYYLDEELLSGKAFIPGVNNSQAYRQVLRKVINVGPIDTASNPNTVAHGITFDANFTLVQIWASATNSLTLRATTFGNVNAIYIDNTNIYIVSDGTYDRCYAVIEYMQEV